MPITGEAHARLAAIPNLLVSQNEPLRDHTRFGIGGPAAALADAADESSFRAALEVARRCRIPSVVVGSGTNLVVSDEGFDGLVLRFAASRITASRSQVKAEAGAQLQALVDFTIEAGLAGLETMTGIPGSVGAAIYGNAGAYGQSISQAVTSVRVFDGSRVRQIAGSGCRFEYRGSVFKRNKEWIVFSVELGLAPGETEQLRQTAEKIRRIRDRKYPPEMRCAGSIFKNLLVAELAPEVASVLPAEVIREGKAPSAWFLDQVGAKGMRRGDIQVADYHANLIYNSGAGTAADLRMLIADLKQRVVDRFGLELEEEVQFVGF
ncbi:MAG: UDP-N-acetylmuramate dehydrogenase [bacterium]|nr:UDP-N-acetylmuramate dehydrogenase [bacterium]